MDYANVASEIVGFIKRTVEGAGAEGVVIGLSGGVDSAVVASLCVRALGKKRVLAILMPMSFTPEVDISDAKRLALQLGIEVQRVDIDPIRQALVLALKADPQDRSTRVPLANVIARVRMVVLYWFANVKNRLVAGTGDKSEDMIGYFTKYGDGGVDFLPIAHLYKTQVRLLARFLGVPEEIASKPSSPQLYPGHKATDEIPVDYDLLDKILFALFEAKLSKEEISDMLDFDVGTVTRAIAAHQSSSHKREYPRMLREW